MFRRSLAVWLLVAAAAAAQKPADLPVKHEITCQETHTGSLLFGVGVTGDAGLAGSVVLTESTPAAGDGCPLCRAVRACWQACVGCLAEASAAPQTPGLTCPYLKPQSAGKPPADADRLERGVLDNLEKLEEARRVYRKAERHTEAGEWEQARACYERVQALCPGSRYDELAAAGLRDVAARLAEIAEEQEAPAGKKRPRP
jgi:hypothetical protein